MDVDEIKPLSEKIIIINEIIDLIHKELNRGIESKISNQHILNYLNNQNIALQEIVNWLLDNQNDLNSIFLLGYLNYFGIEIGENNEKSFKLFFNASNQNHILAQYYVRECYEYGYGTIKDEKLAFSYYEEVANENYAAGQFKVGYLYDYGVGIKKDVKAGCN